jgi:N-acyl homoserine lactone hydrolase
MTKTHWTVLLLCVSMLTISAAPAPASLRLYVFDCGQLNYNNADAYQLKPAEVHDTNMSIACFLIDHPKGALMWDVGAVPDSAWKPTGAPVRLHFTLPDRTERDVTMRQTLKAQLAAVGYSPSKIKYLGLSHYHWDHIANANDFAGATWIARKIEHDMMFGSAEPERTIRANYDKLGKAKTILVGNEDYDVFGDGKVVMKFTPGHTPGHQVLFLDLPKTGKIVLGGDLYHYPEERSLNRVPLRDSNPQQTAASRAALETFLKSSGASLWIQHDVVANAKLKKAPQYYD